MNATLEKIREDIRHNEAMRAREERLRNYEFWRTIIAALTVTVGAFAAGAAWVKFFS